MLIFRLVNIIHFVTKASICLGNEIPVLVEDAMYHAKEVIDEGIDAILLEQPWNINESYASERLFRVHNWNGIVNLILNIKKSK